jgi:hypothetical protein
MAESSDEVFWLRLGRAMSYLAFQPILHQFLSDCFPDGTIDLPMPDAMFAQLGKSLNVPSFLITYIENEGRGAARRIVSC